MNKCRVSMLMVVVLPAPLWPSSHVGGGGIYQVASQHAERGGLAGAVVAQQSHEGRGYLPGRQSAC